MFLSKKYCQWYWLLHISLGVPQGKILKNCIRRKLKKWKKWRMCIRCLLCIRNGCWSPVSLACDSKPGYDLFLLWKLNEMNSYPLQSDQILKARGMNLNSKGTLIKFIYENWLQLNRIQIVWDSSCQRFFSSPHISGCIWGCNFSMSPHPLMLTDLWADTEQNCDIVTWGFFCCY